MLWITHFYYKMINRQVVKIGLESLWLKSAFKDGPVSR